jgi:hypothetical protein
MVAVQTSEVFATLVTVNQGSWSLIWTKVFEKYVDFVNLLFLKVKLEHGVRTKSDI